MGTSTFCASMLSQCAFKSALDACHTEVGFVKEVTPISLRGNAVYMANETGGSVVSIRVLGR